MKKRVPITQIMSKDLITITPVDTLYDAEKKFEDHEIRHIPVVEGKRLVGVISRTDLLRVSYADLAHDEESVENVVYDMYTIPQVMTKEPLTADAEDTIRDVAEIFSKQSFNSLPVTEEGNLIGMVTTRDLVNYLLDQY